MLANPRVIISLQVKNSFFKIAEKKTFFIDLF